MPRLTITLPPAKHRALKEASVRRGKTIRSLVEESLDAYGIKTTSDAKALVDRARKQSGMTDVEAVKLALQETRAQRRRR